MSFAFLSRLGLLLVAVASMAGTAPGTQRILRVAADPNNLPFSNRDSEGFENRLAELIAAELDARIEYLWWPQRRGFFRETVGAGRADVVIGVPAGFERLLTTRPYYRSTYVFLQRAGAPLVESFDDPRLRGMKIGVQLAGDDGANPPPAHALAERGLIDNVRGYTLYGDYGAPSPPAAIVQAVADGSVDIAAAWGPMAGYFAVRASTPLQVVPVEKCDCPRWPMTYAIAVGVRRGESDLLREIDAILERRRDDISRLLAEYQVPLVAAEPVNAARF
jgi:mxaJ protein